jgi:CRISPR-associated protein Cas5d
MDHENIVTVKVVGDYACFTRPDLKVERMTYPCMTPSAARGVLEAVLWKPEFSWYIHRIQVLKPVKYMSVRRNEINSKQGNTPIVVEEKRSQRNSIILKDVAYVIEASVYQEIPSGKNPPKKYVEMFKRRVEKGQCWHRPFLGCREFAGDCAPATTADLPITDNIPIGSMLLDLWYDENGLPSPRFFFDVAVRNGILDCSVEYKKILSSTHMRGALSAYASQTLREYSAEEKGDAEE